MGFGIIHIQGKKVQLLELDVLLLHKLNGHNLKLKRIFEKTLSLIDQYHPDEIAVEAPFFGKNVQSMLKLGRAQGVVMAAGLYRNIPITEYAPKKVKLAVTGSGNASKEQVSYMLQKLLNIKEAPKYFDATDGLAVALCHHLQTKNPHMAGSSSGSWASFMKNNPDRIG